MLKPLDGFHTFKTDHCVTGSMRHVYECNGYPISENLLLGLGAGLGFIYWHMKGMPPFLGGRANTGRSREEGLEKTAGRRTGVRVDCFKTASTKKAETALLDALSQGPAMIQLDMGFLPYLDLPDDYHFGGHVIVVAGIHPKARQALVADRDGQLHQVDMDTLARARGSKHKPFPPKNALFTFDFSSSHPPTPVETWQAIRDVASGMLHPPISNLGVKGIRRASGCVMKWPDVLDEDQLRYTCFNASIFIDATGGTGGGLFRYMYERFLKESAGITGERHLRTIGDDMREIGDAWEEVARLFKAASTGGAPGTGLAEVANIMRGIADKEQQAWKCLHNLSASALGANSKGIK